MSPHGLASIALVALVALATGFVLADQIRAQLLTPSNQVARYQALLRSVQELESTNAGYRSQIAQLRAEIDALESEAAARSATTQSLNNQVADLRAHAGLVAMHGPGCVGVGERNGMSDALSDQSSLPDIRAREVQFQLRLSFTGSPDISLPAYDSSLQIPNVHPT